MKSKGRGIFTLICLLLCLNLPLHAAQINIVIPTNTLEHPVSGSAVTDAINLLQKACQCTVAPVSRHSFESRIEIILPEINPLAEMPPTVFARKSRFPYLNVPDRNFSWTAGREGNQRIIFLSAANPHAVAAGIYGLMQELLGFQFYHPRETYIPDLREWPLPDKFEFAGRPRFDKMGFHLHTQHPLELTRPLLDVKETKGLEEVKEYIDWLARNGQNYFEFNLLEGISHEQWPQHAKEFVDYAHKRGILAGVDISLHMIQQKSWMLYQMPLKSFLSKEKQVKKNLDWLLQADWDVLNMEFSTTEFTGGNKAKKVELQLQILEYLAERSKQVKLMGRKHVVKESTELDGKKNEEAVPELNDKQKELDSNRGVMPHTVMFYSLQDENAPVYGNENLTHMLDMIKDQKKEREVWYYPESAYWVTFDNSVPMFLTPYLSARLQDILLVDSLGVPGHLTFSSGWEWGYWLFDWSIARWSWEYTWNGDKQPLDPWMYPPQMTREVADVRLWREVVELQEKYLKEKNLMGYMVAQTITDEVKGKFNLHLAPRPVIPYREMYRGDIGDDTLRLLRNQVIPALKEFSEKSADLARKLEDRKSAWPKKLQPLVDEWVDGIKITGLRALHRYYVLNYILRKNLELHSKGTDPVAAKEFLGKARQTRLLALGLVRRREAAYRYPLERLARKGKEPTAYHFGYLYPVTNLHFWEREEMQAQKNKWGPFFRNIWNVPRIIGVID
ncbi:MAG: hypothetical protein H6581_12190 [Bacteroidia bacterium]|nr:hypothetical protein [Bacteroidia bacterium]